MPKNFEFQKEDKLFTKKEELALEKQQNRINVSSELFQLNLIYINLFDKICKFSHKINTLFHSYAQVLKSVRTSVLS